MDELQEERARSLVEHLKDAGANCGLLVVQGAVVIRCPGAPYVDSPMVTFDEGDLQNAIALDLLEKRKVIGSYTWEWFVLKHRSAK